MRIVVQGCQHSNFVDHRILFFLLHTKNLYCRVFLQRDVLKAPRQAATELRLECEEDGRFIVVPNNSAHRTVGKLMLGYELMIFHSNA